MRADKPPLSERTLPKLLAKRAEHDPDGVLMTDEQGTLSSADAWIRAATVAGALHRLGIEHQDRVAVMLDNSREFILSWFGLGTLGAVQVPVNPQAIGAHLSYVLRHSGARAIIVDAALTGSVAAVAGEVPELELAIVVGAPAHAELAISTVGFGELLAGSPRFDGLQTLTCADTTAIMYTSGSTGPAKGVVLPHGQHFENGWQATQVARIRPEDRLFVCLPLHHNMAQGYGVLPALVSGASITVARRFQRSTFWDEVCRSGATIWPFVGAMLVLLAKDIGAEQSTIANPLRVAYGVPIPAEVHRLFEQSFDVRLIPCYGSTEATIVAWGTADGDAPVGSCGRIFEDFDVVIQSPNGLPLGVDALGEICIRPREPYIMCQGYHNEPERGRIALRNLWFHSGDRARIDRDGYLWFAGRTEDVIRRFGEFISTTQVEEALLGWPHIDMVAAFGVPDGVAGEELMITVVPRPGASVTVETIREWCRAALPTFSVPRYIDIAETLPMTATGKVERYVLRRRGVTTTTDDLRAQQQDG